MSTSCFSDVNLAICSCSTKLVLYVTTYKSYVRKHYNIWQFKIPTHHSLDLCTLLAYIMSEAKVNTIYDHMNTSVYHRPW